MIMAKHKLVFTPKQADQTPSPIEVYIEYFDKPFFYVRQGEHKACLGWLTDDGQLELND